MENLKATFAPEGADENAGPTAIGTGAIHKQIAPNNIRTRGAAASACRSASDAKVHRKYLALSERSRTDDVAIDDVAILEAFKRASTALCTTEAHRVICEITEREIDLKLIVRRFRAMERKDMIVPVRTLPSQAPDGRGRQRVLYELTANGRQAQRQWVAMVVLDWVRVAAS